MDLCFSVKHSSFETGIYPIKRIACEEGCRRISCGVTPILRYTRYACLSPLNDVRLVLSDDKMIGTTVAPGGSLSCCQSETDTFAGYLRAGIPEYPNTTYPYSSPRTLGSFAFCHDKLGMVCKHSFLQWLDFRLTPVHILKDFGAIVRGPRYGSFLQYLVHHLGSGGLCIAIQDLLGACQRTGGGSVHCGMMVERHHQSITSHHEFMHRRQDKLITHHFQLQKIIHFRLAHSRRH